MATNSNQLDPIAYRQEEQGPITETTKNWQFDPAKLQNADINLSAYWDDSSAVNYNNSALWWWENQKYKGENTKNTSVAYNPNATISWLNPNYAYWQKAQMVNSSDAWYIQRRNDEIASALYNEGKVSQEDVRNYLMQQEWFTNSEANERENTIQSVWKRLGEIQGQQWVKEQPTEEKKPIDESALVEDTSWEIYWKVTPDTGKPSEWITTLADENNIYTKMQEARVANVNALRSMDPAAAAALAHSWTTPYWETTMRDIQSLDPNWYKQYSTELKKLYTQDSVDRITMWDEWEETKNFVDSNDEQIDNDIKTWTEQNSDERSYDQVWSLLENKLLSNQVATSAKQEMLNIKKDLADLNTQLEELPGQANKLFKWDVPQYLVQAYISNNSQKIQSKIKNLENRYSSLSDMYKTEVSQAQRELEFDLKKQQMAMDQTKTNFDMMYKSKQLEMDSIKWDSNWNAYTIQNGKVIQLDNWTAFNLYQSRVNVAIPGLEEMAKNNADYGPCEDFTDDMSEDAAWVRMEWADWRTWTTSDEKNWYATQFGLFSDYIPEIWDVAVFDYRNATNVSENSRKYWHTMYVTWYDPISWMVHLVWSNGWEWLENKVYSKDVSLNDFYNNYWVWFWNPYKYSQWKNMQWKQNWNYSPMQTQFNDLIKMYREAWRSNLMQDVWTLQEAYTILWRDVDNWNMMDLIEWWDLWKFLKNVALFWQNNGNANGTSLSTKDSSIKDTLSNFLWLTAQEAAGWAARYAAQHVWEANSYKAFQDIMRVIEIKLRDESGAAINQWEWWTDFMLYMPQAWDSPETIKWDLERMEEYIRWMAAAAWITSDEYIPLFTNIWKRPAD